MNAADVAVTNTDDDAAVISFFLMIRRTPRSALFPYTTLFLPTSQPTANVTIGLSSSDLTEGTVAPASVTFTSANWNTTQTVTITGVDDFVVDGNVTRMISTAAATTSDGIYNEMNASAIRDEHAGHGH